MKPSRTPTPSSGEVKLAGVTPLRAEDEDESFEEATMTNSPRFNQATPTVGTEIKSDLDAVAELADAHAQILRVASSSSCSSRCSRVATRCSSACPDSRRRS